MSNPKTNFETRARVIIGIAVALIAANILKTVVTQDLSRYSTMAISVAKGTVGVLGAMFCWLLCSSFGRTCRKIVGVYSMLLTFLLLFAAFFGTFAWLLERMPFSDVFGGHEPADIAAKLATYAYIAWAFCFSPAVRAYEKKPNQAAQTTPGLRPSVSDL